MLNDSISYIEKQIDGKYIWKELIVNAVCHRDYSILDKEIIIRLFDDRLIVESPGGLPNLINLYNIMSTHYSRNPIIAKYLRGYKVVNELGEGINRIYNDIEKSKFFNISFIEDDSFFKAIIIKREVEDFKDKEFCCDI